MISPELSKPEKGGLFLEIWDAYHRDGTFAGEKLVRGEPIPEGLFHLVSEVLVRHTDGDFLLMQRDPEKPNYGGFFEATAGGSAFSGEDKLSCAKRELFEETGIISENLEEIGHYVSGDTIYYFFLCITDCEKDSVILQKGETVSYKWLGEKDFIGFINSEEMIPSRKIRGTEYFRKMGYLHL